MRSFWKQEKRCRMIKKKRTIKEYAYFWSQFLVLDLSIHWDVGSRDAVISGFETFLKI